MLLNRLVEINEKGTLVSSVNFGMMDDPRINLDLCEGFIFNYDRTKPGLSTVGILDALRRSYSGRNASNIHLIIQQYGKGKSHFAVAIANFFKKLYESEEVRGILHQIEQATSGKSAAVFEGLKLYKQQDSRGHLVICLSGDRGGDIRKQFLQALLKALAEEGIEGSLAQYTCSEPLRYLEGLSAEDRDKAEAYLTSQGNPDGDLDNLIRLLKENNPAVISAVKNLARHVTGFAPDFSADIDIEALLKDVLDNLCSGEEARFQGILILFDELNYYLQSWAADKIGAGGTALQNITNICELYKGKITLLSFAQIHPSNAVSVSATAKESYLKISSRLTPQDCTYYPESSLELVLDNLLIQKQDSTEWQEFCDRWNNVLLAEARNAYEKRIRVYKDGNWSLEQFSRHLSLGCFPLHPLTAYLLCKLDFTQDRTAIQFVKGYVKDFIQNQPLEKSGKLNYVYPIALIDTFIENFSHSSPAIYSYYQKAQALVFGSEDPHEIEVLKALFLYYASGDKLAKSDREEHEEVLMSLTGLSRSQVKVSLDNLVRTRDVIYHQKGSSLYRFFEGINPTGIEGEIDKDIENKNASINDVAAYCNSKIERYLTTDNVVGNQFVKDNKLVSDDWRFRYKFFTIDSLLQSLSSSLTFRNFEEKGIFAYVVAETQEELLSFKQRVSQYLANSSYKLKFVVGIPSEPAGDLARVLLKIETLTKKDGAQKSFLGAAFEQLLKRWREQVESQIERLVSSCTYYCSVLDKIPVADRTKRQVLVSALLQESFAFVPPVDEIDKMRSDHQTGSKIVGFAAKQIIGESLTPQGLPDKSYSTVIDAIFVSSWGLLKKTSQKYIVQEPTHERVKAAWDKISRMTDIGNSSEKATDIKKIWHTLSQPPYGYTELTFTALLASWLVYHRQEVALKGSERLTLKKNQQASRKTQPLRDWANTDIWEKPRDFVNKWAEDANGQIIRRQKVKVPDLPPSPMDYDRASQYLKDADAFLKSEDLDSVEIPQVVKNKELIAARVKEIDLWWEPVAKVAKFNDETAFEALLEVYLPLLASPPAINIIPGTISVAPTATQRDRASQALDAVRQGIETHTRAQCDRAATLATVEECDNYAIATREAIRQIEEVSQLPEHLSNSLRDALQVAEGVKLRIQKRGEIDKILSHIIEIHRDLDESATQDDYTRTRAEIGDLARILPAGGDEAKKVSEILEDIASKHRTLCQKVDIWTEKAGANLSRQEILNLTKEIASQHRRFTDEDSRSKIETLQERLEKELLKVEQRDKDEKSLSGELALIKAKLQRICDLSIDNIGEAFQVFQDLMDSHLPSELQTDLVEEYRQQVEDLKSEGHAAIAQKFTQICDRQLQHLDDYQNLKDTLQKCRDLLTSVEYFGEIEAKLELSLEKLETARDCFQQQQQDKERQQRDEETIQAIRQLKPSKNTTVCQCEANIEKVLDLKQSLHAIDSWHSEIDKVVESLREKIESHRSALSTLRQRLWQLDSIKELENVQTDCAKAEHIFQESSEYEAYKGVQQSIQLLKNDLELIREVENKASQSNSIASCAEVVSSIENLRSQLQNPDRFSSKIALLESNIGQKVRNYTQDLDYFEAEIATVSSPLSLTSLQDKLMKVAACYADSDLEARYRAIASEITLALELIRRAKTGNLNTIEACQQQLRHLQEWKDSIGDLSDRLQQRFAYICHQIAESEAQIAARQKQAARLWLENLETQAIELDGGADGSRKLDIANKLLKQIQSEKSQHLELLDSDRSRGDKVAKKLAL